MSHAKTKYYSWVLTPTEPRPLSPGERLRSLAGVVALWSARARQRRSLAQLDDHMLRDIGKTRAEALMEAGKPFWRA